MHCGKWIVAAGLTAAVSFWTVAAWPAPSRGAHRDAHRGGDVHSAFHRAAMAGIPGAREFSPPANFSEGPPGVGWGESDDSLFAANMEIARFDWSRLLETEGGVPALVLAQADLHAGILAAAGYVPLDAGATVLRPPGSEDVMDVSTRSTSPGHGRSHGWRSPLVPDRLIHRRLYHAPGTGGFITVRIEYDGTWKAVTIEATWTEATGAAGAPRPFPHAFRETAK